MTNTTSLNTIRPSSENDSLYRKVHSGVEFSELVESIRHNGILQRIVIDLDGVILSGHRRYAAAIEAGLQVVPVETHDIRLADMARDKRLQVLAEYNRGSRVKTTSEEMQEALAKVDPAAAIEAAQRRKLPTLSVKTHSVPIRVVGKGKSKRTDPRGERKTLFDAVVKIIESLRGRDLLPISSRSIHYLMLKHKVPTSTRSSGNIYGNKARDATKLSKLLTDARALNLIDDADIRDNTRPSWTPNPQSLGEYAKGEVKTLFQNFFADVHADQDVHLEVVVEKNTIFDLVQRRIGCDYRVPVTSGHGYISYAALGKMAERFERSGKHRMVVIYATDLDPEGVSMVETVDDTLRRDFKIDAECYKCAVTPEQVERFGLVPDAEAKKSSSRYVEFVARYGTQCYELDSLDPEDLILAIKEPIEALLDIGKLKAALEREKQTDVKLAAMQEIVKEALAGHLAELEGGQP